jgi:hypothetical protein
MFLVLRVTNNAIYLPHTIIPKRRMQDDFEHDTVEQQCAYKCRMISKAHKVACEIAQATYWQHAEKDDILNTLSKDAVTRLFSALDGMRHVTRDIMMVRPDNAAQ